METFFVLVFIFVTYRMGEIGCYDDTLFSACPKYTPLILPGRGKVRVAGNSRALVQLPAGTKAPWAWQHLDMGLFLP